MLSYELVSIFGETYKSLKLLNKDHLIDDFDRYINKKNILKGKYRVVLDCIKFADDPNQFQKIIKYHEDPIQVFKTTRQISDYLNLSGNVDKANFLHLDLLGQNDYRNTKLSDQLDVYNNYYDMRLLGLKTHNLTLGDFPTSTFENFPIFGNYDHFMLFFYSHASDEVFLNGFEQNFITDKHDYNNFNRWWITEIFRRNLDISIYDEISIGHNKPYLFWLSNQKFGIEKFKKFDHFLISDLSDIKELDHNDLCEQIGYAILSGNKDHAQKIIKTYLKNDYWDEKDEADFMYKNCYMWKLYDEAEIFKANIMINNDLYDADHDLISRLMYQGQALEDIISNCDLTFNNYEIDWFVCKSLTGKLIQKDLDFALSKFETTGETKIVLNKLKISEMLKMGQL